MPVVSQRSGKKRQHPQRKCAASDPRPTDVPGLATSSPSQRRTYLPGNGIAAWITPRRVLSHLYAWFCRLSVRSHPGVFCDKTVAREHTLIGASQCASQGRVKSGHPLRAAIEPSQVLAPNTARSLADRGRWSAAFRLTLDLGAWETFAGASLEQTGSRRHSQARPYGSSGHAGVVC